MEILDEIVHSGIGAQAPDDGTQTPEDGTQAPQTSESPDFT